MKVAVLVDLAFAIKRYKALIEKPSGKAHSAEKVAKCLWDTSIKHVRPDRKDDHELYRILCYDCPPFEGNSQNPITKKNVNFSKTDQAKWRREFHAALLQKRSVAIRRGTLVPGGWIIPERETKLLLSGKLELKDLKENNVQFELRQKQVDMKLGIDIASLAHKRLVDRIVLVAGDADFVPAAKLARREGIDFILDPLWTGISPALAEHIDAMKTHWPKPKHYTR